MSTVPSHRYKALRAKDIAKGEKLSPWVVEVTSSLIVAGALATLDAQDVHHDVDLAKSRGFKDIFMNNFTTMGLITRYITDWSGPESVIEEFSFRLGRPQYPNDELHFSGQVTTIEPGLPRSRVTVDVVGLNGLGVHVNCSVIVSIPSLSASSTA